MPMITETTPVTFSDPLPESVDVVIIGGGVVGTATAYFLAERGVKVLLCEKGRIAGEQSSRNWGWVRQQGRDSAELPIMMESNRIWRGLAEDTGDEDVAFTESGCLYLAESEAETGVKLFWERGRSLKLFPILDRAHFPITEIEAEAPLVQLRGA